MEINSVETDRFSCRVTQLYNVQPEDKRFPWHMFSLDISARFLSSLNNDFNCFEREKFLVDRKMLLSADQETSRSTVHDILLEMNINPVRESIIDTILENARTMESNELLADLRILRLRIEIDVMDDDDGVEEEEEEDGVLVLNNYNCLMPASDSLIEAALEEVNVELEGDNDDLKKKHCVICLQELLIGSKAARMRCSHVYHGRCISDWLKTNGVCPLCRFKIVP